MLEVVLLKLKKCGFLLSLVMITCFLLPDLAKADDTNIFANKIIYTDFDFKNRAYPDTKYINDASDSTFFHMPSPSYVDLGTNYNISGLRVLVKRNPYNTIKLQYVFYNSQKKEVYRTRQFDAGSSMDNEFGDYKESYNIKNVRYVLLAGGGQIYDLKMFGSLYRPFITNLKDVVNGDNADFSWSNPIDQTFRGVKIYRGSELIATVDPKESSYKVSNLEAGKEYDFKFVSIYEKDGNILESETLNKKIKTKMPVIKPPENVFVTPQNGKMVIAWDDVKSPYLEGYNIYIDGKKINDKPLNSNKMIIKNLENEKSYTVQISAVNKENAEGEKSKGISEKPSSDALEVEYDVKMPFSPLDLITSSFSLLAILGGFVLLSIAIIWFRPLKELIVKTVRREKDKK